MEDKTMVITMRVIDFANPSPGAWTIPCDECGHTMPRTEAQRGMTNERITTLMRSQDA